MGNLHFKTNVQIKSIIGKDLINDDNIAILELVKNSFDADAKRVDISFCNLKNNDDKEGNNEHPFSEKTSRIIIRDDGVGMDLSDIDDKWLNIAYSEKKSNSRQYNRRMAGAKGVGRFSCDRLGQFLNLYTRKKGKECFLLKIDWSKFEIDDQKKEIQSVDIEYETLNDIDLEKKGLASFKQGVILEIVRLRSNWVRFDDEKWNTDKLAELKKYLEKLINPNQAFEKNDFGIYLNAPEFVSENNSKSQNEKFIGKVENTIFNLRTLKGYEERLKAISLIDMEGDRFHNIVFRYSGHSSSYREIKGNSSMTLDDIGNEPILVFDLGTLSIGNMSIYRPYTQGTSFISCNVVCLLHNFAKYRG